MNIRVLVKKNHLILLVLLFIGLIFRSYFLKLSVSTPIFDQTKYIELSSNLMGGKWGVDCCSRSFGYPLFLAVIFSIFGQHNYLAVRVIQITLDLITGLLLYVIANRV
jgi:hypothetical protein